jgi:multicomponent Na+:H+ antiporter subunit D
MSLSSLPPSFYLLGGALLLLVLPRKIQAGAFPVFPALALAAVWTMPDGAELRASFYTYTLVLAKVDALNRVFGIIFALITLVGGIYALHVRDNGQRVAALLYAGGAMGVTFAGDLFTLVLYWELMAGASTFLIWARRTPESIAAGVRYLLVHLFGGSLLIAGVALQWVTRGDLSMSAFAPGESIAAWLIFAGVAVNAAIPPLHAWLADGYPKATVTGAVFLSALTTKSAVYVLARLFPGWELLIWLGVMMAVYGTIYAIMANDIRQILAYSTISQVGYMVAGVGIGTVLAINGTAAHAFSHILYKALLFMGAGVVIETTGRSKLTELGGLGKYMPLAFGLYMVGAFAISGFPFTNGFISKSMIVAAAADVHLYAAEFLLLLAGVGTFLHTGLKLPYWTWFGRESGVKPSKPIPRNMVVAMGVLAALCLLFGVQPALLYQWLPHAPVEYRPYTVPHLVESVQLLVFTFVVFWLLKARLAGAPVIALDTDWFYRKPARLLEGTLIAGVNDLFSWTQRQVNRAADRVARLSRNPLRFLPGKYRDAEFHPDLHRFPLGLGIALTLLTGVAVAIWSMM